MDKSTNIYPNIEPPPMPPTQSRKSVIVNGITNGATFGALPFVAFEAASVFAGKPHDLSMKQKKVALLTTALGVLGGLWFGMHEAKTLDNYRDALGDQLTSLRTNSVAQAKAIEDLRTQLNAKEAQAAR